MPLPLWVKSGPPVLHSYVSFLQLRTWSARVSVGQVAVFCFDKIAVVFAERRNPPDKEGYDGVLWRGY